MNLPERTGTQVRIGVAIAVPEPFGTRLRDARLRFGDTAAQAIPPHITVLGPTVLEPDALDGAVVHLEGAAAASRPFRVVLRGPGTFRPVSPVVFARLVKGSAECAALEAAVRTGPLDFPVRFPYHPHVTVAHEVPDDALDRAYAGMADFEAEFDVEALHLFEHGDDGVWRPVREFVLGEAASVEVAQA